MSLVTQTTATPTRKMGAVGITLAIGAIFVAVLEQYVPGTSDLFGREVMNIPVGNAVVGVVAWVAGYFVKDRANA